MLTDILRTGAWPDFLVLPGPIFICYAYGFCFFMVLLQPEHENNLAPILPLAQNGLFDEAEKIYDVPCDLVFSCSHHKKIDEEIVNKLASTTSGEKSAVNTFKGVIECVSRTVSAEGCSMLKKRGLLHGPYRATTAGGGIINGLNVAEKKDLIDSPEKLDAYIEDSMKTLVIYFTLFSYSYT